MLWELICVREGQRFSIPALLDLLCSSQECFELYEYWPKKGEKPFFFSLVLNIFNILYISKSSSCFKQCSLIIQTPFVLHSSTWILIFPSAQNGEQFP